MRSLRFPFLLALLIWSALPHEVEGQVVRTDPIFPHPGDTVTVIFDSKEGNGALEGFNPVYAHTGVITNLSTSPTDWRHVQGNWGTADPTVLMTNIGGDRHAITYHIPTFYGIPMGETVEQLAFVFRNTDGSVVGRDADGSDIFYPVYAQGQLATVFVTPGSEQVLVNPNDTIPVFAAASDTATITLYDNGNQIAQGTGEELLHDLEVTGTGNHEVIVEATDGISTVRDTFYYSVNPSVTVMDPPAGTLPGLTHVNATTVRLSLWAPNKSFVYLLGDFNGWQADSAYFMHQSTDGNTWWIEVAGLTAGNTHLYQYWVDGEILIADPYSELVLDPDNDQWIGNAFPNLPAYPSGQTQGIVTAFTPGATPYNWQTTNFTPAPEEELVVYELLVRDFLATHDYATLLDTLDYLEQLGINAIEFMPVNEFEGNESWGYNPSFHMALDKYYGPPATFKALIDECHARGIAVILDVVYNHAFSQSPLCQLYWDDAAFRPSPDNPWLNPEAKHPFNVGYDFNHESQATRDFVERVMSYWLTEYRVDGFRFDLSKGFTQVNSGNDVGLWGQYDASRIAILKDYADAAWAVNPDAYLILEHFGDNNEERELANYGLMFWGNHNYNYNEATMGYISQSNFEWIDYQVRGWNSPKVLGYMESHDEERLMYKNLQFGNSNGGYDITQLSTALKRQELAGALFFTIPGPKLIWQFGELGYDVSIDDPCRLCNKPILWNYYTESDRLHLYKVWSALIHLKRDYATFSTTNYNHSLSGLVKTLHLNDNSMNAAVFGNFSVNAATQSAGFQHTGWWYEYFTGDSIDVTDVNMNINFTPGEYRLYTDVKLPTPDLSVGVSADPALAAQQPDLRLWPNPSNGLVHLRYVLPASGVTAVQVVDLKGQVVAELADGFQAKGEHQLQLDGPALGLAGGHYLLVVRTAQGTTAQPLVLSY